MNRIHGGAQGLDGIAFDFSTNNNACGPCPIIQDQLSNLDCSHYPDHHYSKLKHQLADFHQVSPERFVLAASASEMIMRISAYFAYFHATKEDKKVWYPEHCYGDYPYAAKVWQLEQSSLPSQAQLIWSCEPTSPLGQTLMNAQELY